MAEKKAQMSELLEKVLRKDPEKTRRGQEVSKFLAERAAQAAEGGGGTVKGIGDLISLLPGARAAKWAGAGKLGHAALNASMLPVTMPTKYSDMGDVLGRLSYLPAFTGGKALLAGQKGLAALDAAQFGLQFAPKLGQDMGFPLLDAAYLARGGAGSLRNVKELLTNKEVQDATGRLALGQAGTMWGANKLAHMSGLTPETKENGDNLAAVPVYPFGLRSGGILRAAKQMMKSGKDLPVLDMNGNLSRRRAAAYENWMEEAIPKLSANPEKVMADFKEWKAFNREANKNIPYDVAYRWPQYRASMPSSLSSVFGQAVKHLGGYGAIREPKLTPREIELMGIPERLRRVPRSDAGGKGSRELIEPGAVYPLEQSLRAEQRNPPYQYPGTGEARWLARPGETLEPGRTPLDLKELAAGGAAGGLMAIAGMPEEGDEKQAGLVLSPKNLPRLAQMARENIAKLNATRPGPSANYAEGLFAAKYPKIYETMTKGGPVFWDPKTDIGNGYFSLRKGRVGAGTAFPENFTKQELYDIPSKYFKTLAHEGTHAVDASRFGRVNDIVTKKPISLADWVEKKDDYLKQRLQDPRYQNPELRKYLTEEGYIQNAKEDAKALDKMSRVFGDAAKNPGMAAFEREVLPDPANFSGNYRSGRVDYRDYRNNPIERRAFKAGETGSQTLNTLATLLDDPAFAKQYFRRFGPKPKTMTAGQIPEILGAGAAGLVGASLVSEDGQDQQAAVPRLVKLQRALAMARDAKAWAPREAPVFRTPEGDFPRFKDGKLLGSRTSPPEIGYQRSENLADIGPAELQRRGGSYAYGAVDPQGRARILNGPSMYEYTGPSDATDVLKPQSEGGNRTVRGTLKVTNPLIVPSNSFFGYEAPELVQGSGFHMAKPRNFRWAHAFKTPKADTLKNTTSLEEFNSLLPKNLRINNNEWRNFSNNPNRDFSGASDTIGDLLLTKYARRHGYDAILAKRAYRQGARGNTWTDEMVLPSESRHQPLSKYTASAKTLLEAAQNRPDANAKIDLLRARLGTNKPMAIGAGQSPLAQLTNLTTNAQSTLSPLSTEADIAKWVDNVLLGNPQTPASQAPAMNWVDELFANQKPAKTSMTKEDRIKAFGNPGVKKGELIYFEPHDYMSQKILPKKSYMGTQDNPDFTVLRGKTGVPEIMTDTLLKKSPEKFLEIKEKYGLKAYGGYDDPYWPPYVPKPTGDLLEKLKKAGVVF